MSSTQPDVRASFLPASCLGAPTPSGEQMPVCPVTTCLPSLLPTASPPCFLSSACQRMQAQAPHSCSRKPGTQTTLGPPHGALCAQGSKDLHLFALSPFQTWQPLCHRKQVKSNKQECPWLAAAAPDGSFISPVLTFSRITA